MNLTRRNMMALRSSGGGSGITLLASGTYTKTDNASKPYELKIPVSFAGTPTEAYIFTETPVSGVKQTVQCWKLFSTDNQVVQDKIPKNNDGTLKLSLAVGTLANGNYYVQAGGGASLDSSKTTLSGKVISTDYPFKDNTYKWYIWGVPES